MSQSTKEMLLRPALSGAAAGIAFGLMNGFDGSVHVLGMSVAPFVAIGVSVGAGSFIAQGFNTYILPKLHQSQGAQGVESGLIGIVVPGAAAVLATHFLIGKLSGPAAMLEIGAYGAAGELAGSYAWATVGPMLGA